MLEPRGALHSTIWLRPRAPAGPAVTADLPRPAAEEGAAVVADSGATAAEAVHSARWYEWYDAPTRPAHPALEYETVVLAGAAAVAEADDAADDDDGDADNDIGGLVGMARRRCQRDWPKMDGPLLVAFVCLVASGVGTVVSAKLQAVPM